MAGRLARRSRTPRSCTRSPPPLPSGWSCYPPASLDSAAAATADLLAGLRLAVSGTDVAVIGFSLGEHYFTRAQVAELHAILLGADAHHVTVVAGSGDDGGFSNADFGDTAVKEVSLPASDPLVLAAGGTSLTGKPAGVGYIGETAWNGEAGLVLSSGASGGGFSHLYARPAYQGGVHGIAAMRGVPDVAGEADEAGGWPFVFTSGGQRWILAGFRHQRLRVAVGRTDGAGRPGGPSRPRPGQLRHLPHRPRFPLPPGVPRHYYR